MLAKERKLRRRSRTDTVPSICALVPSIAESDNEGEKAVALAMEEPNLPGATVLRASERIALAEERFVSGMVKDLVARRGEEISAVTKQGVEARIEAMPEPWRSRTRQELERVREHLIEMLAESGERGSATGTS